MDARFPIGRFEHAGSVSPSDVAGWTADIASLPERLRAALTNVTAEQLEARYRPGGWTVRQVVHHLADSHLNSYVRFKWALTEQEPTIKPYDEKRWAELADYEVVPVETSLNFLDLLHSKWVGLLRELSSAQLARRFIHPDLGPVALGWNVGLYAWHGNHHLAHVRNALEQLEPGDSL